MCRNYVTKGPYVGKIKIEFCIGCSREHSAGHFGTKIMDRAQCLAELYIANSVTSATPSSLLAL